MVGGRLRCLRCFFTYCAVLLLGVCLHDVEALSCQPTIHKEVGDTVEFSSCLSTEGVSSATWKYGNKIVADKDQSVTEHPQFKGRVSLNPTNYSLTVRGLTLQDSGEFSFVSEVNDKQRDTVTVTLQVHDRLSDPVLTINSTWHASNESCTVLLECNVTSDSSVTYKWAVRNQSLSGSRLQYILRPQDGETTFTCTVSNSVGVKSVFKNEKCSNETYEKTETNFILFVSVAGGGCLLIVIIVGIVIGVCHHKQREVGSDSNDLTVYADVSDVALDNRMSTSMKPCSVYETIDNRGNTVTTGMQAQTVYDKIQLNRVRKASVSPYQEI
ncbi:signaling lymphocytic activation molecule-like isoform X1 [Lates japonicus]|uniref:Signaling lymphocytic activation molecule-like isoform X1 n=1 Tax=Lates japonicus TaxID=270547 RepID=A0AAD3MZK4_LATJO|nr:signaling lymphocytic activation molecule-like isoform X1 [Lates japonicus]